MKRGPRPVELETRLLQSAIPDGIGCLVRPGLTKKNGRPYIKYKGTTKNAYRLLWEYKKGPIPKDMTLDHLCFNKACLNLEHMELVTRNINSIRGLENYYKNNPTYPCGHPRTPENTYIDTATRRKPGSKSYPGRRCNECKTENNKKYRELRRLKLIGGRLKK